MKLPRMRAIESEQYRLLVAGLEGYAIFTMDVKGNITSWNKGARLIFGFSEKEVLGKHASMIFSPKDRKLGIPDFEIKTALQEGRADDERKHVRKNGASFWAAGIMWRIRDNQGIVLGLAKIVRDIDERKRMEEAMRYQSLHDPLTGVLNRRAFEGRCILSLARAKRLKYSMAVIFIDLDNFKHVNDAFGHDSGDLLLKAAALRISGNLRREDVLCRPGGDEFLVLVNNVKKASDIEVILRKIQAALRMPFIINNKRIVATISMGAAVYPYNAKSIKTLEKRADAALYKAKAAGKNRYVLYGAG